MAVILLVLLGTTVLLSWFGLGCFIHALTFPGRLTGAVLIAVAFSALIAAGAVLDHWVRHGFQYSGLVVLIGVFAALMANAMLLLRTLRSGDSVTFQALFGALVAGSAWAVFAVWRTSVTIPAPKRMAAALVVSSVLAVANFAYQNLYLPNRHQVRPLITLSVGKALPSKDRKAFAVPIDITIQNPADVGFYVLGTEFHAMGERVRLSLRDRLRDEWRSDAQQWARSSGEINPLSRREIRQPGELMEAKPWILPGDWIEPGDSFTTRMVVQVPVDTPYDQMAFYATAKLARKDQIVLDPPINFVAASWRGGDVASWVKEQQKSGLDSLVYRARVHENNAIDENTRDPRFVFVYWTFGPHGAGVQTSVTREGAGRDEKISGQEQRELVSRYGLTDIAAGPVERTLWDIKRR
ncbi:hypothetical protein [Streptomyces cellostaticus]|uniref:hypothetical protein n=1 Tax=Streptomyces cellostaticus TaxID=67285 RepID=UPI002025C290|nr:hypothetical protein [Streptomyces cellostaticus]